MFAKLSERWKAFEKWCQQMTTLVILGFCIYKAFHNITISIDDGWALIGWLVGIMITAGMLGERE